MRRVGAALYRPPPVKEAPTLEPGFVAFGFTTSDLVDSEDGAPEAPIEVWPDNVPAVNVFRVMGGQWRVGPAGPYALDYGALTGDVWRSVGVKKRDRVLVFGDLQVLEEAALAELAEQSRQREREHQEQMQKTPAIPEPKEIGAL